MKFESESEYDAWFDRVFAKMTRGIEDHNFKHFNRAIGCYIYSKEHYKYEMKKRRLVPYDAAEQFADEWDKANPHKDYDSISPKAMDIIRSLKMGADKHGNIKLGSIAIEALIDIGAISGNASKIPDGAGLEGGIL